MSEQTFNLLIDDFEALKEVTLQMRDFARTEQWDELEGLVVEQLALMANLPQIDAAMAADLPEGGRSLAKLIESIADAQDEVTQRTVAWRGELSEILHQLQTTQGNVTRLSKVYQTL